ncbi:MAG: ATP phosphoribosyltransferase regulatory subunit [Oscillospiraceae bacterium]|jgi:ATP phosphoribosyltransferase regulatory subunit|nr:ATP phosphoribosyltransferase regulatory subunit [Oscillospiraceae bacterium]
MFSEDVLKSEEAAVIRLRSLYRRYGYTRFGMSKFEEYELYSRNRSFLPSDNVITFTDAGGRLMALRPDVTLSIVKAAPGGGPPRKLYYSENVYRPAHHGREVRERMQVGLECIGELGVYDAGEVIMLAERSLEMIGERHCLCVSHMGFLSGLLGGAGVASGQIDELLKCVSGRNASEIRRLCDEFELDDAFCESLTAVAALYGPVGDKLDALRSLSVNGETDAALDEIEQVCETARRLGADGDINIDFSIVNDMNYYSGVIFQGFVEGIPSAVLSGGRYDKLMRRFSKHSGAIGFAVYVDLLERSGHQPGRLDADVLLLYAEGDDPLEIADAVRAVAEGGESVRAMSETGDVRYGRLLRLSDWRSANT